MKATRTFLAITIFLTIILGSAFLFLPHDLHEALTFGANIPHFLHIVMGLAIISIGLSIIAISIKNKTFKF